MVMNQPRCRAERHTRWLPCQEQENRDRKGLPSQLAGDTPALPLDGFFALNPAMPSLHRLYRYRPEAAAVREHTAGWFPRRSRATR
jgi:uncharacterized protein (DUF1501 family)